MTTYTDTAEDNIRWVENNQKLFNEIVTAAGISNADWKKLTSTDRAEIAIIVYGIFLEMVEVLSDN